MGIFDSIMGNMSSFGDALNLVSNGFSGANKKDSMSPSDAALYRTERYSNLLASNVNGLRPNAAPGQYGVSKSQPTVSVDPQEIQAAWLRRLDKYSTIAAESKGK